MRVGEPVFSFNQTEYRIKPKVKQIKKMYQFLCKFEERDNPFATGEFYEAFEECKKYLLPQVTVLRRLDHTMIRNRNRNRGVGKMGIIKQTILKCDNCGVEAKMRKSSTN